MSMMSKQTELAQLSSREKNREDRKDQRVDQQSEKTNQN